MSGSSLYVVLTMDFSSHRLNMESFGPRGGGGRGEGRGREEGGGRGEKGKGMRRGERRGGEGAIRYGIQRSISDMLASRLVTHN